LTIGIATLGLGCGSVQSRVHRAVEEESMERFTAVETLTVLGYQPRVIGFQVNPHGVDSAGLGPDAHLSQLFHHPVVNQPFPKFDNLDVGSIHFPELTLG